MTARSPKNVAHSIRDRLIKLARARREDFNFVLLRYALERLLYRLSQSRYEPEFVLKGAMLFSIWSKAPHRATKDMDLLGFGTPDLERIASLFQEVASLTFEDDGIVFAPTSVKASRIKEDAEYEGVRVTLEGALGSARLSVQVDVGFGDAVTPQPEFIDFPGLLELPRARIRAYSPTTVVAEKLQAMVILGMANSRMKDFFDIWFLSEEFDFDGTSLGESIRATFERRQTPLPLTPPLALTDAFALDATKQTQWSAFLKRSQLTDDHVALVDVVRSIAAFAMPVVRAAATNAPVPAHWSPKGPWI